MILATIISLNLRIFGVILFSVKQLFLNHYRRAYHKLKEKKVR